MSNSCHLVTKFNKITIHGFDRKDEIPQGG